MRIRIEGKTALIKEGSSFEYHSENRLFMGRDGYTLNITFPMRDCPKNRAIFGHIERADVEKGDKVFECIIEDKKLSLYGSLKIVKVSEDSIDGQFAVGRSAQTMTDPFDKVYVNDLELGEYPELTASKIAPADAWKSIDQGASAVSLPWINENYPLAPNNWVDYGTAGYSWASDVFSLSWQPYLIVIAKKICAAVGYTHDFQEWENSAYRHLIICNSLPGSWGIPQYAEVMPKWTVSEFFEKLELLLCGEFDFDHRTKSVSFRFSSSVLADVDAVLLQRVADAYSVDIAEHDNCEYIGAKRLVYKDGGHPLQNYYSCDWMIPESPGPFTYADVETMISQNNKKILSGNRVYWGHGDTGRGCQGDSVDRLLYAEDVKTFFAFRSIGVEETGKHFDGKPTYTQVYVLQSVNAFGSGMKESDDVSTEEIEFVPVCINDTYISKDDDRGFMMCLQSSSEQSGQVIVTESGETSRPGNMGQGSGATLAYDNSEIHQPRAAATIEEGSEDEKSEYYDIIYVAFWDGNVPEPGKTPYPVIDHVWVSQSWGKLVKPGLDLRLDSSSERGNFGSLPKIKTDRKFKFSWLSNELPNPRAIFYIHGQRYLCEKITATFTENGMSQLIKGEFYPLIDD